MLKESIDEERIRLGRRAFKCRTSFFGMLPVELVLKG